MVQVASKMPITLRIRDQKASRPRSHSAVRRSVNPRAFPRVSDGPERCTSGTSARKTVAGQEARFRLRRTCVAQPKAGSRPVGIRRDDIIARRTSR